MKKKTALQQLIDWGEEMLKSNPPKTLSFAEAIDMANQLLDAEKEQIQEAYFRGCDDFNKKQYNGMKEYYQDNYGKD